jgi:host factor-I protein
MAPAVTAKTLNLQNGFLNQLRLQKVEATIHMVGPGSTVTGRVVGFDNYVVIVEVTQGVQQLIFKHAIATIVPSSPLRNSFSVD